MMLMVLPVRCSTMMAVKMASGIDVQDDDHRAPAAEKMPIISERGFARVTAFARTLFDGAAPNRDVEVDLQLEPLGRRVLDERAGGAVRLHHGPASRRRVRHASSWRR